MKAISERELIDLTGGQATMWSECDVVVIMGNQAENWTSEQWDAWAGLYDRYCG